MQNLKSILDGKRDTELNKLEILDIVRTFNSYTTWPDRSRGTLYISEAMKRSRLNPNSLLTVAIPEIKSVSDTILVTLALKNGANRNLYVMTPSIGSAHIMVYTVAMMKDKGTDIKAIILVLYILQIMGSQSVSNAFDMNSGEVLGEDKLSTPDTSKDADLLDSVARSLGPGAPAGFKQRTFSGAVAQTGKPTTPVQEWLVSQGMGPFNNLQESIDKLKAESPEVLSTIGNICDRPDLAYSRIAEAPKVLLPIPQQVSSSTRVSPQGSNALQTAQQLSEAGIIVPSLRVACAARSPSIIGSFKFNSGMRLANMERGAYIGLTESIDMYSLEAFIHFLNNGQTATYFTINKLVLSLRRAGLVNDVTLMTLYQSMLLEAVSRGAELDLEQMSIISTTSGPIAQAIVNQHSQPAWMKMCVVPTGPVPDALRTLSFNLGIEYTASKQEICSKLHKFAEADPQALKESAILKQKIRTGAGVSTISDFIAGTVPNVSCQNKTNLQKDPFTYNDATMMFYKDSDNFVWCFTSDTYEALIANPYNPHKAGKEQLPAEFVEQLKLRLQLMKRLGIPVANPVSTTEAIDSLFKPDEIGTQNSEYIVNTIDQSGVFGGIPSGSMKRLTRRQMQQALTSIGMEQDFPEFMTDNHRLITFSRAAYTVIKLQPDKSKVFFDSMKTMPIAPEGDPHVSQPPCLTPAAPPTQPFPAEGEKIMLPDAGPMTIEPVPQSIAPQKEEPDSGISAASPPEGGVPVPAKD